MLLHAPVLQLVDPDRKFWVTTDASDFAIGGVLSQVWDDGEHPVAYESRKLNAAEGNYAMHEKELLGSDSCITNLASLSVGESFHCGD